MKHTDLAFTFFISLLWLSSSPGDNDKSPLVSGEVKTVFEGRTPCGQYVRSLLEIPENISCEMIRWELSLHHDEQTLAPSVFHLKYIYGMNQPNTEGFSAGGHQSDIKGSWKRSKGTNIDPDAIVYELQYTNPSGPLSIIRLNDDVIHLLYRDKSLMIGNAGWSYTLYKIRN